MPSCIRKHLPTIVTRHYVAVLVLLTGALLTFRFHGPIGAVLATATSSITRTPAVVFITPYEEKSLFPGELSDIDININTKAPVNAIGATIEYPSDLVEIVGISKKKSFLDLWTEETAIREDIGEVHFSGGTTRPGGMIGTGTVLTLSIKTKKPGDAKIAFKEAQILAHDGKGTPLEHSSHSYTYTIKPKPTELAVVTPSEALDIAQPKAPSADFDDNGKINLIDVSIITVHLVGPYNTRFDLDMNGSVGLSDLSILFSKMRKE